MNLKIGFGCSSIWGAWKAQQPQADEFQVVALVIAEESLAVQAILVADICTMWSSTCADLRQRVANDLKIDPRVVGIFCTQTHGAPMEGPGVFDADRLARAFSAAAQSALGCAQPTYMASVESIPKSRRVVNRRKLVEGVGSFTFFYGFEVTAEGEVGCRDLLKAAIEGLRGGRDEAVRSRVCADEPPVDGIRNPYRLDGGVDDRVQGIFFRTQDGQPIGSIARWAAHPVTANVPTEPHSADYPVYVRHALSNTFGGASMFLTGPCGNQAPPVVHKSLALAKRTGEQIANELLACLPSARWHKLEAAAAQSRKIALPLRTDLPRSADEAERQSHQILKELASARIGNAPLQRLKVLQERLETLRYFARGQYDSWCGLTRLDWKRRQIIDDIFAARLNSTVVVGLPGEPFGLSSLKLRAGFSARPVIVAEECNGYLSYIPTTEEHLLGGYGAAAAVLDPAAEQVLVDTAISLVNTL